MKNQYLPFDFCNPSSYQKELDITPLFNEEQKSTHFIHFQKYFNETKKNLDKSSWNLEDLLGLTRGNILNNAAQYWYHSMFFRNLALDGLAKHSSKPSKILEQQIIKDYGSLENLKSSYINASINAFGSNWYVCGFNRSYSPSLRCMIFNNAELPMQRNIIPLFVVDNWEHSYYLQYKTNKKEYLEKIWAQLNWDRINTRFEKWEEEYRSFTNKKYWP